MGLSEKIRQQLINNFKIEQSEHIQTMTNGLLALEEKPPAAERERLMEHIFRAAHSLKGGARAVNMNTIESVSHSMESLLMRVKNGEMRLTPHLFDLLYQALDSIALLVERVEKGISAPPAHVLSLMAQLEEVVLLPSNINDIEEEEEELDEEQLLAVNEALLTDETIRIAVSDLDRVMSEMTELINARIRGEQRLTELKQLKTSVANWYKEWVVASKDEDELELSGLQEKMLGGVRGKLQDFNRQIDHLSRHFSNDAMRLALTIDALEGELNRIRMLPLSTITTSFKRMVRDLARERGKDISLTIMGGKTALDKRVLEQIKDPLIHMLRNAVDHGLEDTAKRVEIGKKKQGEIVLRAGQQGNSISIEVSDDGGGIDIEQLKKKAVDRGLYRSEDMANFSSEEALNLIFRSGFSTKEAVSDISGRGVGMDVVRQKVEELNGRLQVDSTLGEGTKFSMVLPLTLLSLRGLLVRTGGQTFAIPLAPVMHLLRIDYQDVSQIEDREIVMYEGKPIALAWLSDILNLKVTEQVEKNRKLNVVVLKVAERRLGLIVDHLLGEQEMVIKNLGKQLAKVAGISGATMLGSGEVILVLHPGDLIKLVEQTRSRTSILELNEQQQDRLNRIILIVDDSLTTRTLEKNILQSAGYKVRLATDGLEAWNWLKREQQLPDLIVSDVNMPNLNGFELTEKVKNNRRFEQIPVILITSLDSEKDKLQGFSVGADAYIVKSSFDQTSLLETVQQLI